MLSRTIANPKVFPEEIIKQKIERITSIKILQYMPTLHKKNTAIHIQIY